MPNAFDQFDTGTKKNPFDQFDAKSSSSSDPNKPKPGEGLLGYERRTSLAGNVLTGAEESGLDVLRGARYVGEKLYGPDPHDAQQKALYEAAQKNLENKEGVGIGNAAARFGGGIAAFGPSSVGEAAELAGKGAKLAEPAIKKGTEIAGKGANYAKEGTKVRMEGWHARTPEVLDNLDRKYSDLAGKHFKEMRASGVTAKPEVVQPLVRGVEEDVLEGGKLYPSRHSGTIKVLQDMHEKAKTGMDVEDLDGFRRDFGQIAYKARLTGNKEDADRAKEAIASIDRHFEELKADKNLPPEMKKTIDSLQKAQAIWSSRRKFETLAGAVKRSEGDPNKLASEFDKILNNPKLHRGFTKEQLKAVEDVAKNTTMEGLQKMVGKFGITVGHGRAAATGNIIPALEFLGGTMVHGAGVPGYAAIAAGTGAKQLYKLGKAGKAERALKSIEEEIPADQALGAVEDPLAKRP